MQQIEFNGGQPVELKQLRPEFEAVRHIDRCSTRMIKAKDGYSETEEKAHVMSIQSAFEDSSLSSVA